jgi:flagellar FlgN protein
MDPESTNSLHLLERRLALMRQLAGSLEQVQTVVVRSDLRGIDAHTIRQQELCEALAQLEAEAVGQSLQTLTPNQPNHRKDKMGMLSEDGGVSSEVRQRCMSLAQELTQMELQVSQLNRVYGALLRRAQRTLEVFMRVLASSASTYSLPKCTPAIGEATLQEVSHV